MEKEVIIVICITSFAAGFLVGETIGNKVKRKLVALFWRMLGFRKVTRKEKELLKELGVIE